MNMEIPQHFRVSILGSEEGTMNIQGISLYEKKALFFLV
jgi:hypothetical protein